MDVKATNVGTEDFDALCAAPGNFKIEGPRMVICCPCGCGSLIAINIAPSGQGPVWLWNGDTEKPTVNPSIQVHGICNWHGFLTNGVFRPC